LEEATGVVDPTVILRIQEELVSIANKSHDGPAASTVPSDFGTDEPSPTELGMQPTHEPNPTGPDPALTAKLHITAQELQQAKATNLLARQVLSEATRLANAANEADGNPQRQPIPQQQPIWPKKRPSQLTPQLRKRSSTTYNTRNQDHTVAGKQQLTNDGPRHRRGPISTEL
jgi:hypothetical protein